mmetsp:Transcript_2415/g.3500  ORF Transcript_2415/g.3500 Transcript_2415/m.3500 type:complete len:207 (-) Transcript_2415:143-763(-)|eukprot:CAMPEP_0184485348 /NCGR_PEP_ID=MMETSP0113_2-20130426/6963_1 /TAXON_ID=91329 /ORGANISM="Norrisiella sphaerica, Strain BC52" /LENGTH=206 /DNA_ID=CAMNT_0026866753 /DNA_START=15 /DNA_END=635 /DNA_ORIENTATION=-
MIRRQSFVIFAVAACTLLYTGSFAPLLKATARPPYRGTQMGHGAKPMTVQAPPQQQSPPNTHRQGPTRVQQQHQQTEIRIQSPSSLGAGSDLPYRASEIGIEAALEMANRKRDVKAVRMLERAKLGSSMQAPSQAQRAQPQSYSPPTQSKQQSSPPPFAGSGPLPYNAEQVGIGEAIEMAMRKKDTKAVRILQWAREEMQLRQMSY